MGEVTDPALLAQLNGTPARGPQPVLTLPDARGQAQDSRADAGLENDQTRTGIALRGEGRDIENTDFRRVDTLAERYNKLPEVKSYRVAVQMLDQALRTGEGAQADLALTYAFAKAMDPESVVRESEQGMVINSQPWVAATVERLKKEFGYDEAGGFTPAARAAIRQQIINSVAGRNDQYNQARQYFTEMAGRNGADPFEVVGYHDGKPYMDRFQQYTERQGGQQPAMAAPGMSSPQAQQGPGSPIKGMAIEPEMVGGLPKGTAIEFGMDKAQTPFDRNQWLQDTHNLTPDQEQMIVAFHNQNRGNQQLTPEAVRAWYQKMGIPQPSDEELARTVPQMKSGKVQFAPFSAEEAEKQYRANLQAKLTEQGFNADNTDAKMQRIGKGAMLGFSDELAGGVNALGGLVQGEDVGAAYRQGRDVERLKDEQLREAQGIPGYVAEMAGGAMLPMKGLPASPTARNIAEVGAGYGAAAGFGYGEGAQDSLVGAATGAAMGGALGYGAGRASEALAARRGVPSSAGSETIAAADRLNDQFGTSIKPLPADVAGPTTRRITGAAAQLPLSAGSIVRGGQAVNREGQAARDAIARLVGTAQDGEQAGEAAVSGASAYMKRSKTKVDALYAKARAQGGDEPVDLVNARAVLDEHIAELADTPGGVAGLERMQTLRAQLDRPYPVRGVKDMRSRLRDDFGTDGLRSSDLERRMMQVVDAAENDIEDALVAAGKTGAAKLYKDAASAHRERLEVIDDVIQPIIGRSGDNSGEAVFANIERLTRGNNARLSKFLAALPPEDSGTVRASIIGALGRSSAGQQGAEGVGFSLSEFLTHWNKMTPGAKGTLFGGELRAALDDLARVAEGTKGAQRYANSSNTGSVTGLTGTAAGTPLGFIYAPATTTALTALQYGGGRLLASPAFARWLARMPSQPGLVERHARGLSRIAATDSAIAADALGLQRQLIEQFGAGPQRLAAQPSAESSTTTEAQR